MSGWQCLTNAQARHVWGGCLPVTRVLSVCLAVSLGPMFKRRGILVKCLAVILQPMLMPRRNARHLPCKAVVVFQLLRSEGYLQPFFGC